MPASFSDQHKNMAAARIQRDVLQMFYGRVTPEQNTRLCPPLTDMFNIQPLQTFNGSITKAIQSLPPELQEKIYKEYLTSMIKQRLDLGFDLVNHEIESVPFCDENQQITKVTACKNCNNCGRNDWCYLCLKNGKKHFLGYPVYDFFDLEDAEFGYDKFVFLKFI